MRTMKAGFIGFLPSFEKFDELEETLKGYANIGYRGLEFGDILLNGDLAQNLKKLNSWGLEPLSVMLPFGADVKNVPEIVKNAQAIGVHRAAAFTSRVAAYRFGMLDKMPSYDEVMREIEDFDAVAKELRKEGVIASFHNHDVEFLTFYRGKSAFDLMVENSEYLKFELDCGWALYGHRNPVQVMDELGEKLCAVHIKDWTWGNVEQGSFPDARIDENRARNAMPRFTMPGTGNLPLSECLKKAAEMGMDYAIVEQDFMYHHSMRDTLWGAYLNMKETGFVE